jgi:hypothetical protein
MLRRLPVDKHAVCFCFFMWSPTSYIRNKESVQMWALIELSYSLWGSSVWEARQTSGDLAQWKSNKKWFPFSLLLPLFPPLSSLHIRPTSPRVLCILLSFVITGYYRNYASACSVPAACYWLPAHHVTLTAAGWKEIQHGAKLLTIGHWPSAEYRNVKLNKQNWASCI